MPIQTLRKRARCAVRYARRRAQHAYLPYAHRIKHAEHWVHNVGYLGGVCLGGGYKWAAAVLLAVFVVQQLLHLEE